MAQDLPPVPYNAPIADKNSGLIPQIWSDWFTKAQARMGGNISPSSLASSGYQKLQSGLYLQWGSVGSVASNTSSNITFPTAFPTACFQVVATITGNGSGSTTATGHFGVSGVSASGFTLNNKTSAAYTFGWLAVGY